MTTNRRPGPTMRRRHSLNNNHESEPQPDHEEDNNHNEARPYYEKVAGAEHEEEAGPKPQEQ